jgi:hypothetical protein
MLEDARQPGQAGSPYGPYSLSFDPAVSQRVLMRARRLQAEALLGVLRRPATAAMHRLRLAGFAAGRFVFDHGGLRSIHH